MTAKYRKLSILGLILSILLNVAPLATYTIIALCNASLIYQKTALCMTVFLVLILSIVSWINKITLRSKLWIILIGLYVALEYILTPLIIIAVCQVLDELLITPFYKSFRRKYKINKEIDKRLP
jgi:hypothetical protein